MSHLVSPYVAHFDPWSHAKACQMQCVGGYDPPGRFRSPCCCLYRAAAGFLSTIILWDSNMSGVIGLVKCCSSVRKSKAKLQSGWLQNQKKKHEGVQCPAELPNWKWSSPVKRSQWPICTISSWHGQTPKACTTNWMLLIDSAVISCGILFQTVPYRLPLFIFFSDWRTCQNCPL